MKKQIICLCAGAALLLGCAIPAMGNSGPTQEDGYTSSGALTVDESSPIRVLSEELIFDLTEHAGYLPYAPQGTVTARYTMKNPTDGDLTVPMVFPYIGRWADFTGGQVSVAVDGEPVEYTALSADIPEYSYGEITFSDMLSLLTPLSYTAEHLDPEQPVTLHRFTLEPREDRYELLIAPESEDLLLSYGDYSGYEQFSDGELITLYSWDETRVGYVLALGDLEAEYRVTDGTVNWVEVNSLGELDRLLETEHGAEGDYTHERLEMTLWEAVLAFVDYYAPEAGETPALREGLGDMVLADLDRAAGAGETLLLDSEMDTWLLTRHSAVLLGLHYGVAFPAGATVEMEVTCPLHGAYDISEWKYDYYTFTYLLSPASHWAGFGELTVTILPHPEADGLILSGEGGTAQLEFTRERDGSYTAVSDGLPEGELVFTMYAEYGLKNTGRALLGVVVLSLAGLLLWRGLRRRREKRA